MAEILEFPTREKQAFAFLEEQLRQMLSARGADDRLIEHAIASLTDVYAELQRDSDCHFEVRLPKQLSREESLHLQEDICLLYTSPSPRDKRQSRMPSSA